MINAKTGRDFSYPGSTASLAPRRSPARNADGAKKDGLFLYNAVDYHNYSGNAIMSAKIMKGGSSVANVEIAVFADGECRAVAMTNDNGVAYLTIPGDDAATLTFKAVIDAQIVEFSETLTYETDAVYGSPKNPVVFKVGGTETGISEISGADDNESVYDLQGRKIENVSGFENGILIINGQKRAVK